MADPGRSIGARGRVLVCRGRLLRGLRLAYAAHGVPRAMGESGMTDRPRILRKLAPQPPPTGGSPKAPALRTLHLANDAAREGAMGLHYYDPIESRLRIKRRYLWGFWAFCCGMAAGAALIYGLASG